MIAPDDVSPVPEPPRRSASARAAARRTAPFAGGIAAAFIALWLWTTLNPGPPPITNTDVNAAIASALASSAPPPPPAARHLSRRRSPRLI